jgi:hypothetical protein
MKKIFIKISTVIFIFAFLTACEDDFVNEPAPTDQVGENVIFGSRTGADAYISGIMRRFRTQFDATDSAGLNSIYYARTVKGNDLIQRNTWFTYDYENDNREPTYRRVRFTWNYSYHMIGQTNILITGVENSPALSDQDKKELIGQAKAIRALFYFQLAQEFQHTYSYDKTLPAPPIVTSITTEGGPMSTLEEMYTLILDDLTYAVANLNDSRLGKSYINKAVANGILSRVYLTMENWAGAQTAANAAYGGGTPFLDASTYGNGFDDYTNPEWIWGSAQSSDQSNYYWGAPHAQADHYTLSYSATYVNNDFVNLFSATDVRALFAEKLNVPDEDYRNWVTTKFTFNFDSDHPIIRTAEMLLTEAEAMARQSFDVPAAALLFSLQSNRDINAVASGNTGADLISEIMVERRKELYAEIGVEWFDAKRTRSGITRTGNQRVMSVADLSADDKKFFLKIPQIEIDANDNIDDSINADR